MSILCDKRSNTNIGIEISVIPKEFLFSSIHRLWWQRTLPGILPSSDKWRPSNMSIRYDAVTMSSSFLSRPNLSAVQFVEKTGHFLKTEVCRTSYRSTELIRNSKPALDQIPVDCNQNRFTTARLILSRYYYYHRKWHEIHEPHLWKEGERK